MNYQHHFVPRKNESAKDYEDRLCNVLARLSDSETAKFWQDYRAFALQLTAASAGLRFFRKAISL